MEQPLYPLHVCAQPYCPHLKMSDVGVLELMYRGYTNGQIARQLGVSTNTVKNRIARMLAILNVDNRTSLVATALRIGLISHTSGSNEPA